MQQRTAPNYPELNSGSGAKWVKNLTQSRLSNFNGGHFSDVNVSSVLFTHRLDGPEYVRLQVWSAEGLTKPTFEEAMKQKFKPAKKGDSFGPSCELNGLRLRCAHLRGLAFAPRGKTFRMKYLPPLMGFG